VQLLVTCTSAGICCIENCLSIRSSRHDIVPKRLSLSLKFCHHLIQRMVTDIAGHPYRIPSFLACAINYKLHTEPWLFIDKPERSSRKRRAALSVSAIAGLCDTEDVVIAVKQGNATRLLLCNSSQTSCTTTLRCTETDCIRSAILNQRILFRTRRDRLTAGSLH